MIVPERFSFLSEEFCDEAAFRGDKYAICSTDHYIESDLNKAFKSPGLWFVFQAFEPAGFLRDFGSIPNKDLTVDIHNQLSQAVAAFMCRMLDGRLDDARKHWDAAVEERARYVGGSAPATNCGKKSGRKRRSVSGRERRREREQRSVYGTHC